MSNIRHKRHTSRFQAIAWSMGLFFALGYLPSVVLKAPQTTILVVMFAATCAVIPFGMRAKTVLRGAACGAALGYVAGMSAVLAISQTQGVGVVSPTTAPTATTAPTPEDFTGFFFAYSLAVAAFCAAVAGGFAYLGSKRRRRIEDQWK